MAGRWRGDGGEMVREMAGRWWGDDGEMAGRWWGEMAGRWWGDGGGMVGWMEGWVDMHMRCGCSMEVSPRVPARVPGAAGVCTRLLGWGRGCICMRVCSF